MDLLWSFLEWYDTLHPFLFWLGIVIVSVPILWLSFNIYWIIHHKTV